MESAFGGRLYRSSIDNMCQQVISDSLCFRNSSALLLLMISRIYLSYHTMSQIVCGVAAGSAMAVLWFILVHLLLTPLFPRICSW